MPEVIPGSLHVANEVLADIISACALECYGIVDMAMPTKGDLKSRFLSNLSSHRGVQVSETEAGFRVDLYIIAEYGTNISAISQNLKDQVTFALKEYACVPVSEIEVHVQGIKSRS